MEIVLLALLQVRLGDVEPDVERRELLLQELEHGVGVVGEIGFMLLPSQLGVTARVEWFDDDEAVDNSGDQLVTTGGVQYYWHRHHFKASLNYTHREELFGPSLDNDTLLLSAHFSL